MTTTQNNLLKSVVVRAALVLLVLAVSVRMFGIWIKGIDHEPMHYPDQIMAGTSYAPDQYRILYPLMWKGLSTVMEGKRADSIMLFLTIIFCFSAIFRVYQAETGNDILAGLALLAFFGTCMNWYYYLYRDTFLEIGLVALAFPLIMKLGTGEKIAWPLALLSLLGGLARESWAFIISGMAVASIVQAGGLRNLIRAPNWRETRKALWLSAAAFLLAYISVRFYYGYRPYAVRFWTWPLNINQFLFWSQPIYIFKYGIWNAGNGILLIFILSLLKGNRNYLPFILGYLVPFAVAGFLFARMYETRIYFPLFFMMIASLAKYLAGSLTLKKPDQNEGVQGFAG